MTTAEEYLGEQLKELKADLRALGETITSEFKAIRDEMRRDHMPRREVEAEFRSRDDRIDANKTAVLKLESETNAEFARLGVWMRWLIGLAIPSTLTMIGIGAGLLVNFFK